MASRLKRQRIIREELRRTNECKTWPNCVCGKRWLQFQNEGMTAEDLRPLFEMFTCMVRRCPDPEGRWKAEEQLAHPVFGLCRIMPDLV